MVETLARSVLFLLLILYQERELYQKWSIPGLECAADIPGQMSLSLSSLSSGILSILYDKRTQLDRFFYVGPD